MSSNGECSLNPDTGKKCVVSSPRQRRRCSRHRLFSNRALRRHCDVTFSRDAGDDGSPHPLFIVTRSSLGLLWKNTVVLVGGSRVYKPDTNDNGLFFYRRVHYVGPHVHEQWYDNSRRKPFDLTKTKGNTLIIVTPLTEDILDSGVTIVGRERLNIENYKSGIYVVLLLSCLADERSLATWPVGMERILRIIKPNIVQPDRHFKSGGSCFAFGSGANFARYANNEDLTVTPFATKIKGEK